MRSDWRWSGGYVDAVGDYRGEWKKIPDLIYEMSAMKWTN